MCELYADDGEDVSFYKVTERKARKHHKCSCCGGSIAPGSLYFIHASVMDGDFDAQKACPWCHIVLDEYAEEHRGFRWIPRGFDEPLRECFRENFDGGVGWMKWGRHLVAMKRRGAANAEMRNG